MHSSSIFRRLLILAPRVPVSFPTPAPAFSILNSSLFLSLSTSGSVCVSLVVGSRNRGYDPHHVILAYLLPLLCNHFSHRLFRFLRPHTSPTVAQSASETIFQYLVFHLLVQRKYVCTYLGSSFSLCGYLITALETTIPVQISIQITVEISLESSVRIIPETTVASKSPSRPA